MEFINDFESNSNNYTKKINNSKYTEGKKVVKEKGVDDICEIIIGNNEIEYESCDPLQKNSFVINKKLEIASNVVKNTKYSKKFTVPLIQKGLQGKNLLSSVLYLNEYYKVNCIIYNKDTDEYYQTSLKNYDPLYCIYKNNSWFRSNAYIDIKKLQNYGHFYDISSLENILTLDHPDIYIYKPFLLALSKYKAKELEVIAGQEGVSLTNEEGKKKIKKQLYDEINLKHYIQGI